MWEVFFLIMGIVWFLASLDMVLSTGSRGWKKDLHFFFFWPLQWLIDWSKGRL